MKQEERIYEILKNSNPGGYKHTPQAKEKLSKMRMGENNPMYGKPASNRGKKRPGVGGRKKGTQWSQEEHKKHKEIRSQPGYYDFTKDPERNRKISEAHKGKIGSAKGKKWFNNGIIETYADECPIGFIKGRLKKEQHGKRGMGWYNNGIINRQFKEGEQLKGFVRGRITKK
jgi:hypothetical protein